MAKKIHLLVALLFVLLQALPSVYTARVPPSPNTKTKAKPKPKPKLKTSLASLPDYAFQFLDSSNSWRVGLMLGFPTLEWSWTLANATARLVENQRVKYNCKLADVSNIKYGVNQYWASGFDVSPTYAVSAWASQRNYYNYTTNTCKPKHDCGVYKQLVWKTSKYLGCAQAKCPPDSGGLASSLTVCYYDPPGNINDGRPY